MSRLGDLLAHAARRLDGAGVPYALVGGLAVSARTEPRFTRDVDLAVAVADDAAAEALIHRLAPPYTIHALVEHDVLGRLATVRLGEADDGDAGPVLDLLFASSGIEAEIVQAAEPLEVLPGVRIPVARGGHLMALKLLSESERRPQDRGDLLALLAVADADDLAMVGTAIDLIVARGTHRDRDLHTAWMRVRELG